MFSKFFDKLRCNSTVRAIIFKFNPSRETMARIRSLAFPKKRINVKKELAHISKMVEDIKFRQDLFIDYFLNPADARPPTGELLTLHKKILNIFKNVAAICEKESIDYWLDYGSLLGAMRHGAIIPWDDDFDISILEKDYDRFMEAMKRDLGEGYTYGWVGMNENIKATVITYEDCTLGIICYRENGERLKPTHSDFDFPHHMYSVPRDVILPTRQIDFADTKARIPADTDSYLRSRYGNYHTLPRNPHTYMHTKLNEYIVFYPDEKI